MAFLVGQVTDPSAAGNADSSNPVALMGRAAELVVSELHGKYLEQCYRGNVYFGSTSTSGVVVPIATTKAPVYTIWNPAGSGKLCVPIVTLISWNATTAALGALIWTATTGAGSSIATTAPFVTFSAQASPVNANLGAGKVSQMKFANDASTVSITAAASFYRNTGFTIGATTVASTGLSGWLWRDEWDGTGIVPPGNAIHLMGSTAVLLTAVITTAWYEIPL